MVMNRLINLFPLLLQKNSMLCYTAMLALYTSSKKFHTTAKKKIYIYICIVIMALLVDPYIFNPLPKVLILRDYNLINYDK